MLGLRVLCLQEMIFPNSEKLGQTIIFVRTREGARLLHQNLSKDGYKCTAIHGAMEHADRDRVIEVVEQNPFFGTWSAVISSCSASGLYSGQL